MPGLAATACTAAVNSLLILKISEPYLGTFSGYLSALHPALLHAQRIH
jgi:hypothetical protein